MSHYTGFVVSVGDRLEEPWMPDEETYTDHVQCDYCSEEDLELDELAKQFVNEIAYYEVDGEQPKYEIIDKAVLVTIPKGFARKMADIDLKAVKKTIGKATTDDLVEWKNGMHEAYKILDFCNPFSTIVVCLGDGGYEDYDTFTRFIWELVPDNDKADTRVWIYGSMDHHA